MVELYVIESYNTVKYVTLMGRVIDNQCIIIIVIHLFVVNYKTHNICTHFFSTNFHTSVLILAFILFIFGRECPFLEVLLFAYQIFAYVFAYHVQPLAYRCHDIEAANYRKLIEYSLYPRKLFFATPSIVSRVTLCIHHLYIILFIILKYKLKLIIRSYYVCYRLY